MQVTKLVEAEGAEPTALLAQIAQLKEDLAYAQRQQQESQVRTAHQWQSSDLPTSPPHLPTSPPPSPHISPTYPPHLPHISRPQARATEAEGAREAAQAAEAEAHASLREQRAAAQEQQARATIAENRAAAVAAGRDPASTAAAAAAAEAAAAEAEAAEAEARAAGYASVAEKVAAEKAAEKAAAEAKAAADIELHQAAIVKQGPLMHATLERVAGEHAGWNVPPPVLREIVLAAAPAAAKRLAMELFGLIEYREPDSLEAGVARPEGWAELEARAVKEVVRYQVRWPPDGLLMTS